ncbi:MAM and LDL-receptor class A domain-containing protein 1 isoform X1 [Octopus bimaculoides]|nr:MAM and LDL-receptor class A domain-containing protein 1 isoform X1 [Octopus bimaculoides]|eukprot:XP_014767790.1 PREDICTED: MAM and LDL-receptor class A domain-containing protein 1-like [Octopus bimaculoides]
MYICSMLVNSWKEYVSVFRPFRICIYHSLRRSILLGLQVMAKRHRINESENLAEMWSTSISLPSYFPLNNMFLPSRHLSLLSTLDQMKLSSLCFSRLMLLLIRNLRSLRIILANGLNLASFGRYIPSALHQSSTRVSSRHMFQLALTTHTQNFQKMTFDEVDTLGAPYDYGSIMHYALNAFAVDRSKWTMIPKLPTSTEIGQRKHLSKIDIYKLNKLYNCNISHCQRLSTPLHGFKQGDDYSVGKVVYFFCQTGFALVGSSERFCKDTGDWTGNNPVCLLLSVEYCNIDKSDLCGWRQDRTDQLDWTWSHSSTPTMNTGPNNDHTMDNSKGSYLYLESSSPVSPGQKARLISTIFRPYSSDMCLRFWYHMFGSSMGELRVYLRIRSRDSNIFSIRGDQGKEWHVADVVIKSTVNFQIVIEAISGPSFRSDIAIDDILITTCTEMQEYKRLLKNTIQKSISQLTGLLKRQRCNFDDDLCGWTQEQNDIFDWTHHYGPTMTIGTGPSCDRTNCIMGKYLYIEASAPRMRGDYSAIYSPVFQGLSTKCITFYYNMYGVSMGTLNVYVKNSTGPHLVWTKSNNQGPIWHYATIDFTSISPFQVVFEGVRGYSFKSDMAFDDFTLDPGYCIEHSVTCDFQRDLCSWIQDTRDKFEWIRHSGPTGTPGTGPNTDHSGTNGYYLYIETSAPRIGGDVARIMSPVLPPVTGGYCFEMAYFMFGSHVSMLTVSLRNHNRETILWIRSGNIGPYWNITRIGFSVSESSQLIIAGVVGESYRSDIAIDDTVLTRGPC